MGGLRAIAVVVVVGTGTVACGLGLIGTGGEPAGVTGGDAAAPVDAGGRDSATVPADDAGIDVAPPPPPPILYAHTDFDLYTYDPVAKTFAKVGPLTGCSQLVDIAVDRAGMIVGVGTALYSIDPKTGACKTIATPVNQLPYTLTFVPKGTVDANEEALVAYDGTAYVRIDRTTGVVSTISSTGITPYTPSGDLVSVEGGGTFVTVQGPSCGDCLLEVNPTTGAIVKNWGSIGHGSVYALGFAQGTPIGFAGNGDAYVITLGATTVTSATVQGPNNVSWVGAGSSTQQR